MTAMETGHTIRYGRLLDLVALVLDWWLTRNGELTRTILHGVGRVIRVEWIEQGASGPVHCSGRIDPEYLPGLLCGLRGHRAPAGDPALLWDLADWVASRSVGEVGQRDTLLDRARSAGWRPRSRSSV